MKITIDTKEEIRKVDKHITALREDIGKEEMKLSYLRDLEGQNSGEVKETNRNRSDWESVYKAVREVLSDRITPLSTRDLVSRIQDKGVLVPCGSRRPLDALSTRLSSKSEFRSHKRKGWTLNWCLIPVSSTTH